MEDELKRAFATAFSDSHREDCVSMDVTSTAGEFCLQYATAHGHVPARWNVASDPPTHPEDGYEVVHEGDVYITYNAYVDDVAEAIERTHQIVEDVGGNSAYVYDVETFKMGRGVAPAAHWLKALKDRVVGVIA